MTREEREKAIDLLDNLIGVIEDNQGNDYDFALKMGIEALKQEPCEDAISREAVLDLINSNWEYEGLEVPVDCLPSVTPTHKKGHWIEYPHEWGDNWQYSEYQCSICHNRAHFDTDYCPNCGTEMESEE